MRAFRIRAAVSLAVGLVALAASTGAALVVDPAVFWWALVLALFGGVPVGADVADHIEQRTRLRIKVRRVSGPGP
ncbi:hypothetical protein C7C46_24150 [Streptomyces tateyamensis]|uniref:Uncharacterized protein n=1 Tax=Streptomyces tateyamensis TaxID=565073 RepID=A0A2V4MX93_9ACTN|nr:hypothetical protein C7C46_24150 [Streptomyces tateyamensis]